MEAQLELGAKCNMHMAENAWDGDNVDLPERH